MENNVLLFLCYGDAGCSLLGLNLLSDLFLHVEEAHPKRRDAPRFRPPSSDLSA